MLIASTNPLIVYYHEGFVRASLSPYDKFSMDRNKHLTNTHLAENIFEAAKTQRVNNMNEQELRDYHIWTFGELSQYLQDSGKVTKKYWVNKFLKPQLKKAMIHIVRMSSEFFWEQSNVYGLFGLDFMLDENFNLWFIEGNPNPQLAATNGYLGGLIDSMLRSLFEIQYGYYRSRMQRVLKVVRKLQEKQESKSKIDLSKYKKEYKEAVSNRLEEEYELSEYNTFELVMDLSLKGSKAYMENLEKECIKP